MDEFLTMIESNAKNSRKEPGCIRFGECRMKEMMRMLMIVKVDGILYLVGL